MKFDPRTKLFILALTGIIVFINDRLEIELLFLAVSIILQYLSKNYKFVFKYGIIFAILLMIQIIIVPNLPLLMGEIIFIFSTYIRKLIPCFILGNFLITTTKVSQFMAAIYKMKIPKGFAIALSITLRYFPTMKEEWDLIKDAMALRGISLSLFYILKQPLKIMEYVYVPMLVSASKISDEITQAAVTRGIDHVQRRTCIENVNFSIQDIILFLVYIGIVLLWIKLFV